MKQKYKIPQKRDNPVENELMKWKLKDSSGER
jgi:hypothetical protein